MYIVIGKASKTWGMGVRSLLTSVRMGTASMAKPTPTVPCSAPAAAVTRRATISSNGVNKRSPGGGPSSIARGR